MSYCEKILLSTAYLPTIQYFSKLLSGIPVSIEVCDNYLKQSYRNRAVILGANGPLDLIIPVKKPNGNITKTSDILIDNDAPWQSIHWKAIVSAYKHSPFFDIFEDELKPLFRKKITYLLEWNMYMLDNLLTIIGEQKSYLITEFFELDPTGSTCDYRDSLSPKKRCQKPDPNFEALQYFQVFSLKHGFQSNLSFIDLLFNEGPEATYICRKCIKKGQLF